MVQQPADGPRDADRVPQGLPYYAIKAHMRELNVIMLARFLNETLRYLMLLLKLRPAPLTAAGAPQQQAEASETEPRKKVSLDALVVTGLWRCRCGPWHQGCRLCLTIIGGCAVSRSRSSLACRLLGQAKLGQAATAFLRPAGPQQQLHQRLPPSQARADNQTMIIQAQPLELAGSCALCSAL